ncbi:unnamed protein product [Nyctereutes procyonoides]|uniref:(raccoon dog) hypothetical protein n=1 Tax=Nyctereutes procyonoides TaxID=34880 RepID=A0A811ZHU7_NYCPR|nr:unnamed protein product [Nyctereutes procyonoides]
MLWEQLGPLPHLVTVCQLMWLPSGGHSSTKELQLVIKNLNLGFAKVKTLVPFLPQSRKPSKESEKQNPEHQNHSNNTSETPVSLARKLSRNITQHASYTVGLKNEEERLCSDGGSGESAYTCHQSVTSLQLELSPQPRVWTDS